MEDAARIQAANAKQNYGNMPKKGSFPVRARVNSLYYHIFVEPLVGLARAQAAADKNASGGAGQGGGQGK